MTDTDPTRFSQPRERLDFETLISDLSSRFVALRGEEVDRGIEEALARLLGFFRVERCGLLRVRQDQGVVHVSHAAYAEGAGRVPQELNLAALFPWSYRQLVGQGESVVVPRIDQLPPEADVDRQTWAAMGTHSSLTVPLEVAGGVRHLIALNSLRREMISRLIAMEVHHPRTVEY